MTNEQVEAMHRMRVREEGPDYGTVVWYARLKGGSECRCEETTVIETGQVWLEVDTNRRILILEAEVHGTEPAWTYIDASGDPEPHSRRHSYWYWHYCDLADFVVWGRFRLEQS